MKQKRKSSSIKSFALNKRLAAVATSILLVFGVGLLTWLLWPNNTPPPPNLRYEDGVDIENRGCDKDDILNHDGIYVPNLDILIEPVYSFGEHKESLETVYYTIDAYHGDDEIGRKISLIIIIQEKYEVKMEELYKTDNLILITNLNVSVFESEHDASFYNYKLGFIISNVRYYIDYQTTSPNSNDIRFFLNLFLNNN